ncbi:MAG: transposase [Methylophaga sp.]|nr:MAG: transposase [Methylophaga sp.]
MPRRPRLKLAGIPLHIIQRGNNRTACFFADEDHQFYLDHLHQACNKHKVSLHAYVLMTNHVHLLLTPETAEGASQVMKQLGQRYVQYINRTYQRSGTLWEGRFRSCIVGEEDYFLACHRYIELNPVRADMVNHPADYPWSSYRYNGQGQNNPLITPHPLYKQLGASYQQRRHAYRELFQHQIEPSLIDQIRQASNGGYVLGTERFQQQIAKTIGQRTWRGEPGRPVKKSRNSK